MARHVTYRGNTIDMDSMRRNNESVPAAGNMRANAKGDLIQNGVVAKTADEIARERGRVKQVVMKAGLKGPMPAPVEQPAALEAQKGVAKTKATPSPVKQKETELPSGDIVVEDDNGTAAQ